MNSVCVAHGPDCKNVLHNFGPREEYEARQDRRRLRRVPISNHYLSGVLNGRIHGDRPYWTIEALDMPADAEVVHVVADLTRDCVVAFVQSKSFDPAPLGAEVPEFNPTYRVTVPDEAVHRGISQAISTADAMEAKHE